MSSCHQTWEPDVRWNITLCHIHQVMWQLRQIPEYAIHKWNTLRVMHLNKILLISKIHFKQLPQWPWSNRVLQKLIIHMNYQRLLTTKRHSTPCACLNGYIVCIFVGVPNDLCLGILWYDVAYDRIIFSIKATCITIGLRHNYWTRLLSECSVAKASNIIEPRAIKIYIIIIL